MFTKLLRSRRIKHDDIDFIVWITAWAVVFIAANAFLLFAVMRAFRLAAW